VVAVVVAELIEPTCCSVPPAVSSLGATAAEISDRCGLSLDAWQRLVLDGALGVRADGNWSAFEVGLVVSRQNGKGGILEARELLGLFELGERLIVHSAHQFDTSMEAFLRMEQLLEEGGLIGELRPRGGISRSHGSEGFVLKDGRRLRYRTRTKGGGRGFSADCVVLDEAMILPEASHSALLPTLSARPNPQVWYTGSAVDQMVHEDGVVFARIRDRGHRGSDSLAYFEWSASDLPLAEVGPELLDDRDLWRRANPAMGIRITEEYVVKERESLDERGFAVERLGVGDWPPIDRYAGNIIRPEDWAALEDRGSSIAGGLCFAFDLSPKRSSASVAVSGRRPDGKLHVEVVDHRAGTGWVVPRLKELVARHGPLAVVCDGPARSLTAALLAEGVQVDETSAGEYAEACGLFLDAVTDKQVHHLGTPELATAIRGASTKPLGDAWKWSRRASSADITPLVACTLAMWAAGQHGGGDIVLDWEKIAA
jgi:hypothetical protein